MGVLKINRMLALYLRGYCDRTLVFYLQGYNDLDLSDFQEIALIKPVQKTILLGTSNIRKHQF